jgi:alpha-beta hydrolase superfamily lysophospholipase
MTRLRRFLIVGTILSVGHYGLYRVLLRLLERLILKTKPNGSETPASLGFGYEDIHFLSGNRHLRAWFVPSAPDQDAKKAILIYHGIYESISEWIPVQHYLWEQGIASMVFDYSGFGDSQGRASLAHLREDAQTAYQVFLSKINPSFEIFALGYSLGTGVLMEAVRNFPYPLDGLILVGAFSSFRDVTVQVKALPPWLTFVIPYVYNNVQAVQQVNTPLLMIHSQDDQLFPLAMASKIFAAVHEPKRLVVLKGLKHNDMLEGKTGEYLSPVVEYIFSRRVKLAT